MPGILAWIIPVNDPSQPTPPGGIWGGGNQPFPTPPIPVYPGGTPNPPGTWGGGNVPFPTPPIFIPPTPGVPPIIWPPTPEHPIVIPPKPSVPPPDLKPEHPIVLPPANTGVVWQMVFVPANGIGWVWALIPTGEVPIRQPK